MLCICQLKRLVFITLMTVVVVSYGDLSVAYQPDAAFEIEQKRNIEIWRQQETIINSKLNKLLGKYGKRPNIIYILADDIGWGELGSYGGGKVRGTPTPNLDVLASQGMKLNSHYSEPTCTPTRVALMTGRIPARTGLDGVLFPGQTKGLVAEEYTLAELLSDSGYHTAMFGKWHLGEKDEHQPTNQGFDYAFYTLYNGGVWPWAENSEYYDFENTTIGEIPYQLDMPKNYKEEFGIDILGILESRKRDLPKEIAPLSLERYNKHDDELADKVISYVEQNAKSEKPFFVYYASNANQVFACPPEYRGAEHVDEGNCQASQLAQHDVNVSRIIAKLNELNIAENTLVVWMSDNGPMYRFFPSSGYSWLRGHKGQAYEGGVRTPAIAYWPGVIETGQDPMDLIHVTDWYTTAARIAGGFDKIPSDRVTDGIDQTSFLINGEGYSHRNYIYHYANGTDSRDTSKTMHLAAVRYRDVKRHIKSRETYNIIRDPGEKFPSQPKYLWFNVVSKQMIARHKNMMQRYPNRVLWDEYDAKISE